MDKEFKALQLNNTWTLVHPPNCKIIGCKWVFKTKKNLDGSIQRLKAWLVARGHHQTLGFDFQETFSLVVKPVTI